MDSLSIGLDIGSSAVRAAEVEIAQGQRVIRRYAQVGLPEGYVVDGEVVNVPGVTEAVKRLWAEGRFSSNRVVLGVSGPRVFVRQADVSAMNVDELRSSLRFDGQELVPISLDDASFDFSVLEKGDGPDTRGLSKLRVLLVAAHQDAVSSSLAVLKGAGLTPVAIDSTALALLRAVPAVPTDDAEDLEVLVSIGAELTTVAVRQAGVPRFIRTLTMGGTKLTASIANSLHLEMAVAERLKRGYAPPETPELANATSAMATDMRDLAEDIRATIEFFASQADGASVGRLLVSGGASQTAGLANAIAGSFPVQVLQVAPFAGLQPDLDLDDEGIARASATAITAVGLALWPLESPLIRLSVLPEEVARERQTRRNVRIAACGLAGLVGLLVIVSGIKLLQVHSADNSERSAEQQVTTLTAQVQRLQTETAVHGQMLARGRLEVAAVKGDIDWVRTLQELAAAMPANVHITSFSGTRAASGPVTPGASAFGNIAVSVSGTGNADTAAAWLDSLLRDSALTNTVISGVSISTTNGVQTVTFSSNSSLTNLAQSNRPEAAQP